MDEGIEDLLCLAGLVAFDVGQDGLGITAQFIFIFVLWHDKRHVEDDMG